MNQYNGLATTQKRELVSVPGKRIVIAPVLLSKNSRLHALFQRRPAEIPKNGKVLYPFDQSATEAYVEAVREEIQALGFSGDYVVRNGLNKDFVITEVYSKYDITIMRTEFTQVLYVEFDCRSTPSACRRWLARFVNTSGR